MSNYTNEELWRVFWIFHKKVQQDIEQVFADNINLQEKIRARDMLLINLSQLRICAQNIQNQDDKKKNNRFIAQKYTDLTDFYDRLEQSMKSII